MQMPGSNAKPSDLVPADLTQEAERLMVVCNSCRYCEGYCAVFPAMERRMNFTAEDIDYLANLCHNCAECFYACQYAPPHEFAINVPKVFAEVRAQSYQKHAWPQGLAALFRGKGILAVWAVTLVVLAASLLDISGQAFYDVIPHGRMIAIFVAISVLIFAAHIAGFVRFWKMTGEGFARLVQTGTLIQATRDALSLKNLSSGGAGCTYPNERHSQARRVFHHFTFYGFALCFASTTVAAIYDNFFGWVAPYSYLSLPVILGTLGGLGLLIGPVGLYRLKQRRDPMIADVKQDGMDVSFLALLFLTSGTGFLLLLLRETSVMGVLLVVHLAVVLALFLTLPYGKFVHGIYRVAALVKNALEETQRRG
jgi:citrate/tricarballylate utilization protein